MAKAPEAAEAAEALGIDPASAVAGVWCLALAAVALLLFSSMMGRRADRYVETYEPLRSGLKTLRSRLILWGTAKHHAAPSSVREVAQQLLQIEAEVPVQQLSSNFLKR